MDRRLLIFALLVGSTLMAGTPARGQGRGSLNSSWGGIDLLLNPVVQKELDLDPDQVEKSRDLSLTLLDRQKVSFAKLEGLAGNARIEKSRQLASEQAVEAMKAVEAFLKPDQFRRFRQVDLQQRGSTAFVEPEVVKSLEISGDQVARIEPILNHSIILMREALSSTRGDRRASAEKIRLIRNETDTKALEILSGAQQARWGEMTGRPLELNPPVR